MLDTAHELRNYLTVIDGYCDLGAADQKPAAYCFAQIREASARCELLLKRLFERSRAGHGPIDLNLVVDQLASSLAALPGPTVAVKVLRESDLPVGPEGDAAVLFGALFNLCLNACKAMAAGGTLELRTAADANHVSVSVGDTGCGMSAERLLTLWDRRLTANNEHGRGLSIVRTTIEELGGTIAVESAVGEGTKFTIRLPR